MSERSRRQRHKRRSERIKIPKAFPPGVPITIVPGRALRVALLGASADELFGVDLASGAFVRIEHAFDPAELTDALDPGVAPRRRGRQSFKPHIISCVPRVDDPIDPGRPEALWLAEPPRPLGTLKPRHLRRLANAVVAHERRGGLILGSRGPSIAYADLDPLSDSVMLVGVDPRRLRLMASTTNGVSLSLRWGGITQRVPVSDLRVSAAARAHPDESLHGEVLVRALGYKPGFALVAFDRVRDGYVRKVVVALLSR